MKRENIFSHINGIFLACCKFVIMNDGILLMYSENFDKRGNKEK